jgi:hypothetical protein
MSHADPRGALVRHAHFTVWPQLQIVRPWRTRKGSIKILVDGKAGFEEDFPRKGENVWGLKSTYFETLFHFHQMLSKHCFITVLSFVA